MLFWTKNSRSDTMRNDAIGVFDSGMGGLTAVKELNAILPHENIIYFGDTARIPYGSRSPETVLRYAKEDVAFLRQYAVKMIIAACGTVSSIVGDQPFVTDMPFTGVVLPASETACRVTRNGKIGVIGTPATIRSGSYEKAIHKMHPEMTVFGQACPLFVHLVENGYTDLHNPVTRLVAEEYLEPVRKAGGGYADSGMYPLSGHPGDHRRLYGTGSAADLFRRRGGEICPAVPGDTEPAGRPADTRREYLLRQRQHGNVYRKRRTFPAPGCNGKGVPLQLISKRKERSR